MDEIAYLIGKLDEHHEVISEKINKFDFESQVSDFELEHTLSYFFGDMMRILDYIAFDIFEKKYAFVQEQSLLEKVEKERRRVYFPISDSEKDFESKLLVKKVKSLDKSFYLWLKQKQAFIDKSNNVIGYVGKLNNDQKHRKLQVSDAHKNVYISDLTVPNTNIRFTNVTFSGPKGMNIIENKDGPIPIEHLPPVNVDYYLVFSGANHIAAIELINRSLEKIKEIAMEYLNLLEK
ncbi:hypothetical protein [Exiguobacterium oxidotolerans]|uniref:Uncharacterized protein n=1 Tax=Exiguobacterium oxidotolerans TaxID=223958 RepID=A0A653IIC0_9BACL|nr:hypothetical protein [Exiguobacterium oxidotolerans]VWX38784.1 hypothetical protein EXIGUO9Y_90005 [Exiguobacterium oxidotolerans]